MTDQDARKLGRKIAQQSNGVTLKFGRTNGKPAIHLIQRKPAESRTIFSDAEWNEHPWNTSNRPRPEKEKP